MNYKELLLFVGCCNDIVYMTGMHCPYADIYGGMRTWCWDCEGCKMEDMCFTALEMGWA